jgi:hypothetical protein
MQALLNKLENKSFKLNNKTHKVMSTKIVDNKAVIKTNLQSFVKLPSELDVFMESIEIVQNTIVGIKSTPCSVKDMIPMATPIQEEIIENNARSRRVVDRLEDVFNELSSSNKISEETYKKAAAMVSASNAIVQMQMINYKFLALNK